MTNEQLIFLFAPFLKADEKTLADFKVYAAELLAWNKKTNITAITGEYEIYKNHFLDSLSILPLIKPEGALLDVGTGGGFPGLVLKIVCPGLKVTVMDSVAKKVVFLDHIIDTLKLSGVESKWGRAEEYGKDIAFREQFDYVTARAVAPMPVLAEFCIPFVKVGGVFIAQKGRDEKEIERAEKVIEILGGKLEEIRKVKLPGDDEDRNIAVIRKVRNTTQEYPRKPGIPEKRPIKAS